NWSTTKKKCNSLPLPNFRYKKFRRRYCFRNYFIFLLSPFFGLDYSKSYNQIQGHSCPFFQFQKNILRVLFLFPQRSHYTLFHKNLPYSYCWLSEGCLSIQKTSPFRKRGFVCK